MCGRYSLFAEENEEIRKIIQEVNDKYYGAPIKTGEIYPTNNAPILINENSGGISTFAAFWGFPNFRNKGVIINARAETAADKQTFQKALFERRCVVPTTGFYEWDEEKNKYLFKLHENPTLYLAGIYSFYNDEARFVILTTSANKSISKVHDRMPVILEKDNIKPWVSDNGVALNYLHQEMPILESIKQ